MNEESQRDDYQEQEAARLTAYSLGQLGDEERACVEDELQSVASRRQLHQETEHLAEVLVSGAKEHALPAPSQQLREQLVDRLDAAAVTPRSVNEKSWARGAAVVAFALACVLLVFAPPWVQYSRTPPAELAARHDRLAARVQKAPTGETAKVSVGEDGAKEEVLGEVERRYALARLSDLVDNLKSEAGELAADSSDGRTEEWAALASEVADLREEIQRAQADRDTRFDVVDGQGLPAEQLQTLEMELQQRVASQLAAEAEEHKQKVLTIKGQRETPYTTIHSPYYLTPPGSQAQPVQNPPVVTTAPRPPDSAVAIHPQTQMGWRSVDLNWDKEPWHFTAPKTTANQSVVWGDAKTQNAPGAAPAADEASLWMLTTNGSTPIRNERERARGSWPRYRGKVKSGSVNLGTEQYSAIVENNFQAVTQKPVSTFSIDVDTASYANVRRFLNQDQAPPPNAVRIEELINYFRYDYPAPQEEKPFSVNLEVAECPWRPEHQLVRIGLQGKEVPRQERPPSNLVFLLDVSGSMEDRNKLPLLKQAMRLLVEQLNENDRVTIATYAGEAGLKLETTHGENHPKILEAIRSLRASGSTNGGAGIELAYEKAGESFLKEGVNRVILATDGDLNVGVTDDDALVKLITEKAASGVFLTVLGFGEGNLKDGKLEKLADNGNGMYAYIDSLAEARKVLVEQISGSLITIAKDVKVKVEFNPAEVAAYRLLGYENRLMTAREFNDDTKDAGEIGAGHSVTALYEVVPVKPTTAVTATELGLKYQRLAQPAEPPKELTEAAKTGELMTLFLRYKQPDADESTLLEFSLPKAEQAFDDASSDFRFAASVASFGMVLRGSKFRGTATLDTVQEIASAAVGANADQHRIEFLDLLRLASDLTNAGE